MTPDGGTWIVQTADGDEVQRFDTEEDAWDMASAWNHAYPAPEYVEFIVTNEARP